MDQDELTDTQKSKAKWTQMEALIGSERRIRNIAQDLVSHFEARQEVFAGKGMIVCMSRRIAADLYSEIVKLRPDWHADDLNKGVIKVVMTAASSDGPIMAQHHSTKQQRKLLEHKYTLAESSREIADAFGQSDTWVRTTLCRVRTALRQCIENKINGSSELA